MSVIKLLVIIYMTLCLGTASMESDIQLEAPSKEIIVAILDTGIDAEHPELVDNLLRNSDELMGWNVLNDTNDVIDDNGHGTHLAGIVREFSNHVKLLPIKVLDHNGVGTVDNLVQGIEIALEYQADIVLVSLGTDYYREDLSTMVRKVWNHGGLLIAAAGNSGNEQILYPAGHLYALGIASTVVPDADVSHWKERTRYELSERSNSGIHVSIAAPGDAISSTLPTYEVKLNQLGYQKSKDVLKGTSQAAAVVAGIAAQYWSEHPSATNDEIYRLLEVNANSSDNSWNENRGYGEVSPELEAELVTQQGRGGIYGQVLYEDYTPAGGVRISLQDGDTAITNEAGMFRYKDLPAKEYQYVVNGMDVQGVLQVPAHSDYLVTITISNPPK